MTDYFEVGRLKRILVTQLLKGCHNNIDKKFSRFVASEIYKAFYKIENKTVETALNIKNITQL